MKNFLRILPTHLSKLRTVSNWTKLMRNKYEISLFSRCKILEFIKKTKLIMQLKNQEEYNIDAINLIIGIKNNTF